MPDGGYKKLGFKLAQALLLANVNEEFLKGLLLLDKTGKVHVFPASAQQAAVQAAHNTYIYTADTNTGHLTGYSLAYSQQVINKKNHNLEINNHSSKSYQDPIIDRRR